MEHGPFFYLIPWFSALALSLAALFLIRRIPFFREPALREEKGREQSLPRFYRLGGALLSILFLSLLLFDNRLEWNASFIALCVGSLAIAIFSVADDFEHVSWPWHLAFQALLGALVYSAGMRLEIERYLGKSGGDDFGWAVGLVGVVAWVVLIMNAINWSDGTDGLMPGVAFLSFGAVFLLALRPEVNQPAVALLGATLLGLSLGLILFNWYPAKILSGTGGAYFFGFTLAVLALYAGMKVATLLFVLAVPVFDAIFVLIRRVASGRSPFLPDTKHLHHLLLSRGWSPAWVASFYLFLTGLMGVLALSLEGSEKMIVFLTVAALFVVASCLLHGSPRFLSKKRFTV